jgi:NAD(P)-dependent dehydrogenase (short-subunit alcohol dehydrogenase family)
MDSETVVVAGVGPGLGASVAKAFAAEGCRVALLARTESYVESLAADLPSPGDGLAVQADLTDPAAVRDAFEAVREAFGPVDVLVNNASGGAWKGLTDLSVEELDHALGVGVRGGFVCAQEAVEDMLANDGGTVVFTGATSAVRGRGGALAFSAAKFGVRGMAESMARELGPEGIHVAHVVVDGGIRPPDRDVDDPAASLDPDEIATNYVHLAEQERSAWTLELDLRPHVEEF